jgi:hypothetical protein
MADSFSGPPVFGAGITGANTLSTVSANTTNLGNASPLITQPPNSQQLLTQESGSVQATVKFTSNKTTKVIYNVGCVTTNYFGSNPQFLSLIGADAGVPVGVTTPDKTFTTPGTNKGVIAAWAPDVGQPFVRPKMPNVTGFENTPINRGRYMFQFHYNPTQIGMSYSGGPETDMNFELSGQDISQYYPGAANVSQSVISFSLVLNRIGDMRWYDQTTGLLRADVPKDLYPKYVGSVNDYANFNQIPVYDQKRIYEKGTMYDLEYLLAVLLGYEINSNLRGVTSDMGWTSGIPVEIHLGKNLRYQGVIGQLGVTHQLFDERMVPILSTIQLSFNRIPDYIGTQTDAPKK